MTHDRALRLFLCSWAVFLGVCVPGCGGSPGSPHPVDAEQARATLKAVLDSWRDGKTPQWWKKQDPRVVVQDVDWEAGRRLKDYELLSDGEPVDANLHCRVRLTLADSKGADEQRTVTYLVGTSPVRTVFRQVMP